MTRPSMSTAVSIVRTAFLAEGPGQGTGPTSVYATAQPTFRTLLDQYPAIALVAAAIVITDLTGAAIGAGSAAALDALDVNDYPEG